MKTHSLFFTTLASILAILLVLSGLSINTLYSAAPLQEGSAHRETDGAGSTGAAPDPGDDTDIELVVGDKVTPLLSRPLRSMPASLPQGANPDAGPRRQQERTMPSQGGVEFPAEPDALLYSSIGGPSVAQLGAVNFDGLSYESGGSGYPPDPVGEVGPTHYFQSVNSSFQIFNKSGVSVGGPYTNNTLWAGQSGRCAIRNDGNPVVLYDQDANRWLFAQFVASSPYRVCVAISQNENPLGSYFLYEFNTGEEKGGISGTLADYFKFGVGADGYYMSASETAAGSGYTAYAFDREKMLLGQNAGFIKFKGETNFLLPADIEGETLPPNGTGGYFYTFKDATFHNVASDRIELFELRPDYVNGANSTFTRIATLPITPFAYTVCGFFNYSCIPQPDTTVKVDALSEWPMFRFVYRNFGASQSLVGNFTVDVGNDRAGIRWFELRPSNGTWQLYQEGTVAPGAEHRWAGSISIDQAGDIALGYNVSSDSVYPSLAFVHRLASDPLGQMRAETILHPGTASQTNTGPGGMRWGEYSDLTIDPVDNCTFWYTSEYYDTSSPNWKTRVATFMVPGCDTPQPTPTPTATGTPGEELLLYIPLVMSHEIEEPTPTPTKTPTVTPTQTPNLPLVNGNFEQGSGVGWTEYSTNEVYPVVRTDIPVGEYQGQYAAWLSGVNGRAEITQIYQQITVPAGARLYYRYYIQSQETVCDDGPDVGYVAISVNGGTGTPLITYQLCQVNNTTSYKQGSVSLAQYQGQTVTLIIGANTDATLTSNLFIDSVGYTPAVAESTTPPIIPSQLDGRKTSLTPAPPTTAPLPIALP